MAPLKRKEVWGASIVLLIIIFLALVSMGVQIRRNNQGHREATYRVKKQDLVIDLVESGSLKAKKSTPIAAQLQREATILYVVDEGIQVKQGDILAELDKTNLEQDLQQGLISIEQMESDVIQKERDFEIQRIQNESEMTKAKFKVEMARMDMEKYEKGEGPQKIKEVEANLEKAKRDMQGMPELLEKGFVTQNEFLDAQVALDKAQTNYDVLMTYTHPKELQKIKSDYEEACRELEATKMRLENVIAQKETGLNGARRQLKLKQDSIEKLKKDINGMTLKAPNDGIVIYGSGDPYDWRGREIRVGGRIYGQQTLITLPDTSIMQVACKVHEVDVDKIKAGQEVDVSIDAYPELKFKGKLEKVGLIAKEKGRYGTTDVKTFDVDVLLEGSDPRLKPGMSSKATIHVNRLKDVLCVPVEAVFENEGKYHCYVLRFGKKAKIEVRIGQSNDNFIEVADGLKEGDVVVLSSTEVQNELKGGS